MMMMMIFFCVLQYKVHEGHDASVEEENVAAVQYCSMAQCPRTTNLSVEGDVGLLDTGSDTGLDARWDTGLDTGWDLGFDPGLNNDSDSDLKKDLN